MYSDKSISLVIPCYNEEEGIEKILRTKPDFIDEVIVVDNGSEDNTVKIAEQLGAKVYIEKERGYGRVYRAGLPRASGDIIVTMDGDDSYPVEEIGGILEMLLQNNYDFISGCRFPLKQKNSMHKINQLSNAFITWLMAKITNVDIKDTQSGMWIFKRGVLSKVISDNPGMGFSQEIKLNAYLDPSISFAEAHIDYRIRIGCSKFRRIKDGLKCLSDTVSYFNMLRNKKPSL